MPGRYLLSHFFTALAGYPFVDIRQHLTTLFLFSVLPVHIEMLPNELLLCHPLDRFDNEGDTFKLQHDYNCSIPLISFSNRTDGAASFTSPSATMVNTPPSYVALVAPTSTALAFSAMIAPNSSVRS